MSAPIKLTKLEREVALQVLGSDLDWFDGETPAMRNKKVKALQSAVAKIEASEFTVKKSKSPLAVGAAIDAIRGVLGNRLLLPPGYPGGVAPAWWAMMSRKLLFAGATVESVTLAATNAAKEWAGQIKAQSIFNQLEALCQERAADGNSTPRKPPKKSAPLELDTL